MINSNNRFSRFSMDQYHYGVMKHDPEGPYVRYNDVENIENINILLQDRVRELENLNNDLLIVISHGITIRDSMQKIIDNTKK